MLREREISRLKFPIDFKINWRHGISVTRGESFLSYLWNIVRHFTAASLKKFENLHLHTANEWNITQKHPQDFNVKLMEWKEKNFNFIRCCCWCCTLQKWKIITARFQMMRNLRKWEYMNTRWINLFIIISWTPFVEWKHGNDDDDDDKVTKLKSIKLLRISAYTHTFCHSYIL
jgi:hypothetical protein